MVVKIQNMWESKPDRSSRRAALRAHVTRTPYVAGFRLPPGAQVSLELAKVLLDPSVRKLVVAGVLAIFKLVEQTSKWVRMTLEELDEHIGNIQKSNALPSDPIALAVEAVVEKVEQAVEQAAEESKQPDAPVVDDPKEEKVEPAAPAVEEPKAEKKQWKKKKPSELTPTGE